MTVGQIIAEPLTTHRKGCPATRSSAVKDMMDRVGLLPSPDQPAIRMNSPGGQCQRIGIAQALIVESTSW